MLQLSQKKILCNKVPRALEAKKLVLVLTTSTPVTGAREETVETPKAVETAKAIETTETGKDGKKSKGEYPENLAQVPCICYPINFEKKSVSALFDLVSEVNMVHPAFAKELGLLIRLTDIGTQKIDGTTLDTFEMVVVAFSVADKANRVRFFEEIFLVANVSPEVVLGILFLTLSDANIDFLVWELRWRIYTTEETLPTIKRVKLVGKKTFTTIVLDLEHETYVIYVGSVSSNASPSSSPFDVYPSRRPQISDLIAKKAPTKVPAEYSDFANIFSSDLASELPKHTRINDHAIDLVKGC